MTATILVADDDGMAVVECQAAAMDERRFRELGARQVEVETVQLVEDGLRGALVAGMTGKREREEAAEAAYVDVDPLTRLVGDAWAGLHEAQRLGGLPVGCANHEFMPQRAHRNGQHGRIIPCAVSSSRQACTSPVGGAASA